MILWLPFCSFMIVGCHYIFSGVWDDLESFGDIEVELKYDEDACPICGGNIYPSDIFCMICGAQNLHFNIEVFRIEYEGKTVLEIMNESCNRGHPEEIEDMYEHDEIYYIYPFCNICGERLVF